MIIQTSCSELLVDTAIHNAKKALKRFTQLFKEVEWESSPPISLKLLQELKVNTHDEQYHKTIMIYDKYGNRAYLEYGDNWYIITGYRLDSSCNHCDEQCYPIFKVAIEKLNGKLIACDGGTTSCYYEWDKTK